MILRLCQEYVSFEITPLEIPGDKSLRCVISKPDQAIAFRRSASFFANLLIYDDPNGVHSPLLLLIIHRRKEFSNEIVTRSSADTSARLLTHLAVTRPPPRGRSPADELKNLSSRPFPVAHAVFRQP